MTLACLPPPERDGGREASNQAAAEPASVTATNLTPDTDDSAIAMLIVNGG